jgi:hypothetical protein
MDGGASTPIEDRFRYSKTKEETNAPTGKAAGRGRRPAKIRIVKVLIKKWPGSPKNVVECLVIILEQLFWMVKGLSAGLKNSSRPPGGFCLIPQLGEDNVRQQGDVAEDGSLYDGLNGSLGTYHIFGGKKCRTRVSSVCTTA